MVSGCRMPSNMAEFDARPLFMTLRLMRRAISRDATPFSICRQRRFPSFIFSRLHLQMPSYATMMPPLYEFFHEMSASFTDADKR